MSEVRKKDKKKIRIVLSCQNRQELDDLMQLSQYLMQTEPDISLIYYDIFRITGEKDDLRDTSLFSKKYNGINLFKRAFNELSITEKLFLSIINSLHLSKICFQENSNTLIFGVPLFIFRLTSLLMFWRVKTVSYIRGIVVKSEKDTSFSSNLQLRFGVLGVGPMNRIISDYYADKVFCVGKATGVFINSRNVPIKNIYIIGSIYCDSRFKAAKELRQKIDLKKEIVFISSAFAAHGCEASQDAQTGLILRIYDYLNKEFSHQEFSFIVRKHPREDIEIYRDFIEGGGVIDESASDPISSYSPNALFLSPMSTLLFELYYLEKSVALIADDHFIDVHREWYSRLNTQPITNWKSILRSFVRQDKINAPVGFKLDGIFHPEYRGRVVSEIARIILEK